MEQNYITQFNDYNELLFSKQMQLELFKRHTHAELEEPDSIVYKEKDVLILLQMLQNEIEKR